MAKKKAKKSTTKKVEKSEEINEPNRGRELAKKFGDKLKDEKILYAWLAAFLSIVGFVIAIIVKRDDDYVMYYNVFNKIS